MWKCRCQMASVSDRQLICSGAIRNTLIYFRLPNTPG
jgi:hypothetical protein